MDKQQPRQNQQISEVRRKYQIVAPLLSFQTVSNPLGGFEIRQIGRLWFNAGGEKSHYPQYKFFGLENIFIPSILYNPCIQEIVGEERVVKEVVVNENNKSDVLNIIHLVYFF